MAASPDHDPRAERDVVIADIDARRSLQPRRHHAPLGRLLVSPDGSFWIERADAADAAALEIERMFAPWQAAPRPTRWDLFDAAGEFIGAVELPPRFTPMAARGTEMTGVLKDGQDVEYIATFRALR